MGKSSLGIAAAALSAACLLTGCSVLNQVVGADSWKDWTPEETALSVYGDGSVTETIFDSLNASWYTGDELQDMIARSMKEYNAEWGEDALNVTEYSDEGGQVRTTLVYKTGEDYARYNNVAFFSGSMLDAELEGYLFTGPFAAVDGVQISSGEADQDEALSHKEYSVVISDGTHAVQVPGEIRFISAGAQMINSHAARSAPVGGSSAEDAAGTYVEPALALSDKEFDRTLLYIIYEKDQDADLLPSDLQQE